MSVSRESEFSQITINLSVSFIIKRPDHEKQWSVILEKSVKEFTRMDNYNNFLSLMLMYGYYRLLQLLQEQKLTTCTNFHQISLTADFLICLSCSLIKLIFQHFASISIIKKVSHVSFRLSVSKKKISQCKTPH